MRRLAGLSNDVEHVLGGEVEDRQPVEDLPARDAHALVAAPRDASGALAALVAPQSESVDQPPFEAGMRSQVAAQFSLDGPGLMLAGAEPLPYPRPHPPVFHAFKQRFSGGDGSHDERHTRWHRALDMLDRARPLDPAEGSVNYEELVAGNDPGE